ncbi:MAG: DUF5916 domain-containing protein [Flavobacteriales bacterium]
MSIEKIFRQLLTLASCTLVINTAHAQEESKTAQAVRTAIAPKLDGNFDDECWMNVPVAKDFVIDNPTPFVALEQKTEVRMVYDDEALYIAFMNYDTAPDSILKQLTGRDNDGNSDYCGITFNCYRDGVTGYTFAVSPLGEQWDARASNTDGEDVSWSAVWYCKTQITPQGWAAEYKIPFAALRFPDVPVQQWNFNFIREVRRTRHHAFWSPVDPAGPGYLIQMAKLEGIEGIKPPRRVFFYPYASAYYNTNEDATGKTTGGFSYNGGLDLKLGLSDAYTLDATLIPDFGQTISDQLILNLSAFDIQFSDNRPFFMEGLELFSRAGIFYSRRIGFDEPINRYGVYDHLSASETVVENPDKDQVINAMKISGRGNKGLGFGFFNAVTAASFATVRDSETGAQRQVQTSPMTNYNVFVFDQNLPNSSYLSVINTSVLRSGDDYDANVTGYQMDLRDKKNKYSLQGNGAINMKFGNTYTGDAAKQAIGHAQNISLSKVTGNLQWEVGSYYESDTYDPNDLGFLQAPNSVNYYGGAGYNIFKPFGIWNRMWSWLGVTHNNLYKPYTFTDINVNGEIGLNSRNFNAIGLEYEGSPVRGYDYFEPREPGRVFRTFRYNLGRLWISSDYRKVFALDAGVAYAPYENDGRHVFNYRIAPRLRASDKLFITYVYSYQSHKNDLGFSGWTEAGEQLFGRRDVVSHTNVLNVQYAFGPWMNVNTRFRHYWGYSNYKEFFDLQQDGYLAPSDSLGINRSFNSFTIDMIYKWIFSMGSELNIVWKHAIIDNNSIISPSLQDDLDYTFQRPQNNSFSVRAIFFVDARSVAAIAKRKSLSKL